MEAYNPYRFNSKRWDPATGGYDMGFRDYSPGLNRFLTRDMYNGALSDLRLGSDPWTGNRYAFAGGNPITGIEFDGHCPMADEGGCAPSLSAHDSALVASIEPAEKWMAKNNFEGDVTIDVGKGSRNRNKILGGAKDGSGNDGYADMIIWGKGKDAGNIFVYEVKPANEYGMSGIRQLNRYVSQLRKLHPGAIVEAGPDLEARTFTSAEGPGRVWSNKQKRNDRDGFAVCAGTG